VSGASTRAEKVETGRIEAFSDGVVAIAMTMLGLELKAPPGAGGSLAASLAAAWPSYLAFFTSFVTVTIVWINHHRLFTHIVHVDHALLLLNSLLLMVVTLVPFGTAVLADHITDPEQQRTAAMLYSGIFIALTGAFNLLWRHAARHHRLLDRAADQRTIRRINLQYGFGRLLYVGSLGLALFAPWASVALNLLVVGFFALPMVNWTRAAGAGFVSEPAVRAPEPAIRGVGAHAVNIERDARA
jgi:uncharacterized membrane protein